MTAAADVDDDEIDVVVKDAGGGEAECNLGATGGR